MFGTLVGRPDSAGVGVGSFAVDAESGGLEFGIERVGEAEVQAEAAYRAGQRSFTDRESLDA